MSEQESFEMFAHRDKNGNFCHVFPAEIQLKMCGPDEIIPVTVTIDDSGEYWGWKNLDREKGNVSMIFYDFFSLAMCFPYGIEVEEKAGKGIRTKLRIEKR